MKFLNFLEDGQCKLGVVQNGAVVALERLGSDLPGTMQLLIGSGQVGITAVATALAGYGGERLSLDDIEWQLPIQSPSKFLCLGLNYVDHAKEGNNTIPDHATIFMRTVSSFVPHRQPLLLPVVDQKLDYEAELVVVIGKQCKYLTRENALDAVWGYSIINEGSMRRYQRWSSQWTLGKNFDRSGGFGPWLVTADELPPGGVGLAIEMRLNGVTMQRANTADMVFDVVTTLVEITECMTLQPGDCIAMGTPAGVGYARTPPVFMRPGDIAEVEVEGVGVLRNSVVAEQI